MVENIEFSAEILTQGQWPTQESTKCRLPKQLTIISETFGNFYKHKFKNQQLKWLFNNGEVQIQTTYLGKNYQLIVNCFQTAILILFNYEQTLTYQEIQNKCDLSDADLREGMLRMCSPRTKILLK